MKEIISDDMCFVCGKENKSGLNFEFSYNKEQKEAEAIIIFEPFCQGWKDIVHGGLISTVLDEIQIKVASFNGFRCVTAELNIKFKRPVKTLNKYFLSSKITKITEKIIYTEAVVKDQNSKVYAISNAKLFIF